VRGGEPLDRRTLALRWPRAGQQLDRLGSRVGNRPQPSSKSRVLELTETFCRWEAAEDERIAAQAAPSGEKPGRGRKASGTAGSAGEADQGQQQGRQARRRTKT
jgi:hypothetical protein